MSKHHSIGKNRDRSGSVSCAAQVCCEQLEQRQLLAASWTALTNKPAVANGVGTMILLSDGTVMVNEQGSFGTVANPLSGASNKWFRLTPDSHGNYANGTWSAMPSMGTARRFFGSVVLQSGKVLVVGGEYDASSANATDINTAEIYNPFNNTWTAAASYPQSRFGDGTLETLPSGKVLGGYLFGSSTSIYDPATNTWANGPTLLNGDTSSEESWVKLADGSLLTYAIQGTQPQRGQRLIEGQANASDAGAVPVALDSRGGNAGIVPEIGGAYLLKSGKVFYVGGSNATALYTPPADAGNSTGTWTAGPNILGGLAGGDAPGCVLPNGHVIFAVGTLDYTNFPVPTTIDEYNPDTNTLTTVTGTGVNLNVRPFSCRMLMLPDGHVLFANGTDQLYEYDPGVAQDNFGQPFFSNIQNIGGNTFQITGSNLTGVSEGAGYGDDAQMATNYPIVRLEDTGGVVKYARTLNWSSTGVRQGTTTQTVQFTLPAGFNPGSYLVNVITNGVWSGTVLNVQVGAATTSTVGLEQFANGVLGVVANNASWESTWAMNRIAAVMISGDSVSDTIVTSMNLDGRNLVINGGGGGDFLRIETSNENVTLNGDDGDDFFDFDFSGHNLSNISGATTVNGGAGTDQIFAYDNATTGVQAYTITSARFDRPNWGGFFYAGDVEDENLTTGTGDDFVTIPSTFANQPVFLFSAGGRDTINIGSSNGVQSIRSNVTINNSPSFSAVNINDTGDSMARTATMDFAGSSAYGEINNLAPAHIIWKSSDVSAVNITTGSAADTVIDYASNVPVTISSSGGNDTVSLGDSAVNGAQNISSSVYVANPGAFTTLDLDDFNDPTARTVTMNYNTSTFVATVTGLAPATITYQLFDVGTINLETGNGNDTINDLGDTRGSNIYNGGGTDAVIVGNSTTGMQNITSFVSLHNSGGSSTLSVTDAGDTTARTVNVNYLSGTGSVSGFSSNGGVSWTSDALVPSTPVSILTGSAADTVNVLRNNVPLSLSSTGGGDLLNIGNTTDGCNSIAANISVINPPSFTTVTVNDVANPSGRNWTVASDGTTESLFLSPTVSIGCKLSDTSSPITMNLSNAADNVRITGTDTRTLNINGNNGNDVFTIGSAANTVDPINVALGIDGGAGTDSLIFNNAGDTTEAGFTVTANVVSEPDMATTTFSTCESLEVRGGSGTAPTHTFNNTPAGVAMTILPGSSKDLIRTTGNGDWLTVKPSLGLDDVSVNDGLSASGGKVKFDTTTRLGTLTIKNLGNASAIGSNMLVSVKALSITGNGVLDLNSNDMILDYTGGSPLAAVQSLINSARTGGTWTGAGITSTTARNANPKNTTLAAMEATDYKSIYGAGATFDGESIDTTAVLVKYTYYGDTDFNGKVNFDDYVRTDAGLNNHRGGWLNGDFDGNGLVNFDDYVLIDLAFNTQTGVLRR